MAIDAYKYTWIWMQVIMKYNIDTILFVDTHCIWLIDLDLIQQWYNLYLIIQLYLLV